MDIGGSLTPEENAFFESGGESPIPTDTGADNSGSDSANDGNGSGSGDTPDAGKQPNENKAPQHVPLAALQEERAKRKALGESVKGLETQIAELRGKFSIIDRLGKPDGGGDEAGKGPPKPEDDIFGAVNAITKRLDDADKAKVDADKAAADRNTFVTNYRNDAATFEQANPDYKQAYNFLLQSRAAELQAIGYDDPKALHDAIVADEYAIAQLALSKGKSPAEVIYGLAKQRGYKAAAGDKPGANADPDAAAAAAERLANIERGQNANKSLNGAGGGAGENEMTAERLLAMPMAEFEAWVEKNPAKARRIMGG